MSEQITCELNGIKYLLVELPLTKKPDEKYLQELDKDGIIFQGIKQFDRGGLFTNPFLIIKVLVPENKVPEIKFSKSVKLT